MWNSVLPTPLQSVSWQTILDKDRDEVMISSAKEVKGQTFAFRQEKNTCALELRLKTDSRTILTRVAGLRKKIRRVKSCCHCSDIVWSQADLTNNHNKQTICCFLSEGRACYSVNTHDSSVCVRHKNSTQLLLQNSAHSAQWLKMLQLYFLMFLLNHRFSRQANSQLLNVFHFPRETFSVLNKNQLWERQWSSLSWTSTWWIMACGRWWWWLTVTVATWHTGHPHTHRIMSSDPLLFKPSWELHFTHIVLLYMIFNIREQDHTLGSAFIN